MFRRDCFEAYFGHTNVGVVIGGGGSRGTRETKGEEPPGTGVGQHLDPTIHSKMKIPFKQTEFGKFQKGKIILARCLPQSLYHR